MLKSNKMEHTGSENNQVSSAETEYHALEKMKVKKENKAYILLHNNNH